MNTSHSCALLSEFDSSRQALVSSLCTDRWANAAARNTLQRILNWTHTSVCLCLSERPLNRLWQSHYYLAFNVHVNTAPVSHRHDIASGRWLVQDTHTHEQHFSPGYCSWQEEKHIERERLFKQGKMRRLKSGIKEDKRTAVAVKKWKGVNHLPQNISKTKLAPFLRLK